MEEKLSLRSHTSGSVLAPKIVAMAVVPLLILSVIASFFIAGAIVRNYSVDVVNELRSECITINTFISRKLKSSDYRNSEIKPDLFDSISQQTNMDITLFFGSERSVTTVKNPDGTRAVGTYADEEIASHVLVGGEDYFSEQANVNGNMYFAYYMPLFDVEGNIVGMTFAGKSRASVYHSVMLSIIGSLAVSWSLTAVVAVICGTAARKMVRALKMTAEFMGRIASGDTECELDERVISRRDEIGGMGRAAVKLQRSLRDLISNDPLTGLFNRRACNIRLAEMLDGAKADDSCLTVVIGDIDFFKKFNDRYGHACGDLVLRDISDILRRGTKGAGIAARWGGEEFLLAFSLSDDAAMAAMENIMQEIRNFRSEYDGEEISVTMTFGVQHYAGENNTDVIINAADEKLYYGKNHGRNMIVEHIPDTVPAEGTGE